MYTNENAVKKLVEEVIYEYPFDAYRAEEDPYLENRTRVKLDTEDGPISFTIENDLWQEITDEYDLYVCNLGSNE